MERKPFELKQIVSFIDTDKLEALQAKAERFDRAVELLKMTTAAKGYIPVRLERRIERFLCELEAE